MKLIVDGNPTPPPTLTWLDQFTMLIERGYPIGYPDLVTIEYTGPDPNLRTTWDKQWEPWAPTQAYRAMGSPYSGTKTHSALGPTDNVDVADVGILFIDCSANAVTIGGLVGGVDGQHLNIVRLCAAVNDVTLEHNEAHAFQKILLHRGEDETLTGEYGGWTLVCNGSNWYDVSHAKHV